MNNFRFASHAAINFYENSAVILDLRRNTYYALNDSAADFCKYLTELGSLEAAMTKMTEIYAVPAETIRQDMQELVNSLTSAGLLEREPNAN